MLIKYKCNRCPNEIKKLYKSTDKIPGFLYCGECGGILEKEMPDVSMSSVEHVDNGLMARRIELRKDITKRIAERNEKYHKNKENRERILKKDED